MSRGAKYRKKHAAELAVQCKQWQKANPLKRSAHFAVNRAIRSGRLVKPLACEECGIVGAIDGHHDDYGKPLEVRWLCRKCHSAVHGIPAKGAIRNVLYGEAIGTSKLKRVQVDEIRKMWSTGLHTKLGLAQLFNVSEGSIRDIIAYVSWKK